VSIIDEWEDFAKYAREKVGFYQILDARADTLHQIALALLPSVLQKRTELAARARIQLSHYYLLKVEFPQLVITKSCDIVVGVA
jgi:hypothetical protein